MQLAEALHNNRYKIVDKWVEYTLSTYLSSSFFKKEKDQFANPTGGTVRNALTSLFQAEGISKVKLTSWHLRL